ncbi:MAG: carboxypeptidase-like regulatory domain-containing protein [Gemmatimonadota bacterium]|nr:carboxypeptidase-like regulatory domain-containing protein [Gemmatimonadota bacterium]
MNRAPILTAVVTLLLVVVPPDGAAQTVLLRVLDAETSGPMVGALAYLTDANGETVKNALTDERGRALFIGIAPGSYRVRAEMIGMGTASTELFDIAVGTTITEEIRMESSAIQLEGIEVELESDRCTVRPGVEGAMVAQIWDEARKALQAASFTDQRDSYRYETVKYDRQVDRQTGAILSEERNRREGYMKTPFESHPAEDLVANGFVQQDGQGYLYMAPDANVLLSDAFLDTHCFRITDSGRGERSLIGLGFQPTGDKKSVPDIAGTMWLDPETAELQWLEFTYEYLEPERTSDQVGGRVDFQRMPDGTWIVPEWWIRMPIMGVQTDFQGRQRQYIARFHQTGGLVTDVREAGGRSLGQRAQTGGVEGVVLDSLGVPMRGVRVGIIGSNQDVFTNAEGEFSITGLTEGRYQVRFVDVRLEGMGYIPEPAQRDVIRGEMSRMEYHMPSMGDVLFEACRGVERREGTVVLAGTVVDEIGRVVPNATVRVQWTGFYFAGGNRADDVNDLREQSDGLETTTTATGAYHFCGVPGGERLTMVAQLGDSQSRSYEVVVPDHETGAMHVLELSR